MKLVKLLTLIVSLFFILSLSIRAVSAQEYVQPVVMIPADKTSLIDQYQSEFPRVYTSLQFVQQRFSTLLGGPTFKLLEPQIIIMDQTSSRSLSDKSYNAIDRIITEYLQFFDTDNKIYMIWIPGVNGHAEKYNNNGSEINAVIAGFNGKVSRGEDVFNVIWLPADNFKLLASAAYGDLDNGSVKTAAHEIGHAYGLKHPCTIETTAWCTPDQVAIQPLAPSDDAQKSIMGYNSTPFTQAVFNNTLHNPDIKTLLENPYINPNGKSYPEPDDTYLYKEGVVLQTTQLSLYPGSKSPVRISGKMFGEEKGQVEFTLVYPGFGVEQTITVPDDSVEWSNESITISVDESFAGSPMAIKVTIVTPTKKRVPVDGDISVFASRSNQPPSVSPNPARNGDNVTISGGNFGDIIGEIIFPDFSTGKPVPGKLPVVSWNNNEIIINIPQNNLSKSLPLLILPANHGGFYANSLQIEENNSVTKDIFFQVNIQCTNSESAPQPGDVGVFLEGNLGTPSLLTSGLTDSSGYISFLTPVTFNYGQPKNITFTMNRNTQTLEQTVSVYPYSDNTQVNLSDPTCSPPEESYSLLISNDPLYGNKEFSDGSPTIQIGGLQGTQTLEWTTSNQGDGTIFITKITLEGNEELQITGALPGDIIDIPTTNIKLSVSSPNQTNPQTEAIASEVPSQISCNPNPWSNKDTGGDYRCDGDQACYAQWQEDDSNNCQATQIGEYCEHNERCSTQFQNTQGCPPSNGVDEEPYSCENGYACYNRWKIPGGDQCQREPDYDEEGNWFICQEDANCGTPASQNAE